MDFVSILDLKKVPEREDGRPVFYLDLNLNQVIEKICALWENNVSSYYYYLPADKECEDYRREVLADVQRGETYEILCRFVKQMKERSDLSVKKDAVRGSLPKSVWFIREAEVYCDAFLKLLAALQSQELTGKGMRGFRDYLASYVGSDEFQKIFETVTYLQERLDEFRLSFQYENERIYVELLKQDSDKKDKKATKKADKEDRVHYDTFLHTAFCTQNKTMKSPFDISLDVSELEQEILKILQKERPEFFKQAKSFHGTYEKYTDDTLMRFVSEIEFYLSFVCFEKHMQELGYVFSAPTSSKSEEMKAYGLYDLALACTHRDRVIPNDMTYLEGEKFFVLTGPNQGGKTTFARSLGQLVYFTKMGLDVPAKSACVPDFADILTHFSVEESVETGRGKLKEELVRLQPMMDGTYKNAFVIINELFTTAANYDACIMGKRVLQHFLSLDCRGIYVTHLKELADPEPGIVSLRAMLDENGKQSFEILRSPAVESANAMNQVNKYHLTYAQLKERLS